MTRSPAKTDMLRAQDAHPVVADALDPDAVARAATRIAIPLQERRRLQPCKGETS